MSKIVFDLEANGLLYDADKIWCVSTLDLETGNTDHFGPDEIHSAIDRLMNCDLLIGHNIAGYDIPLLEKWCGEIGWFDLDKLRDTYVMSKLFWPAKKYHSLDHWGKRLGIAKPEHEDWTQYSPEMRHRNEEDVRINAKLYEYMIENECKPWPKWINSLRLETKMHYWQAMQEEYGVGFDKEKAEALVVEIDNEIKAIDDELDPILPIKYVQVGQPVVKPFKKNGEYTKRVEDWFENTDDET